MLVDLKTILADTREKHYAVGLFNCVTLEMTKGILAAAEELHSPVIIGPAESLLPGASLAEYADMMLGMARRAGVPVALHFDHGFTPELVEEAAWAFPPLCTTAACCPLKKMCAAPVK